MTDEIKYCKFCNKEKPIKEFVKSGFAIKNICRECQNKKQAQIYRDSKKVKELEKENQELKKQLEEMDSKLFFTKNELEMRQKSIDNKLRQQKEFIEWLEDKINFWKDKIFENAITENDWTLTLWRNKLGILEEILLKYKEVVGDIDESV